MRSTDLEKDRKWKTEGNETNGETLGMIQERKNFASDNSERKRKLPLTYILRGKGLLTTILEVEEELINLTAEITRKHKYEVRSREHQCRGLA